MTLFTFRAFQILGENLLCFAVWCLRSLKVIKCSALHDISVYCRIGASLLWNLTAGSHQLQPWRATGCLQWCCGPAPGGSRHCLSQALYKAGAAAWQNAQRRQNHMGLDKHKVAASHPLLMGSRGDLLSTWGTPVMCPLWWLASLLEISQACGWHPYREFPYFSESAWSWQFLQDSWPNEGSKFVLLSWWNWAKLEDKEK